MNESRKALPRAASKALVPRTVPITGYRNEVDMALHTQERLGRLVTPLDELTYTHVADGRVLVKPVVLVAVAAAPPRRKDDTFRQIGIALAFVSILGVLGLTLIYVALTITAVRSALFTGVVIAALIAICWAMRSGTKGDCPGVTTHCPPAHHK